MDKTFDPQKYNLVFCSVCNGKGKLPKNPDGFEVCKKCGGFGLIKKEMGTFEEAENEEQTAKAS